MNQENPLYVRKSLDYIVPVNMQDAPLRVLKDKFFIERQANGSNLLVINGYRSEPITHEIVKEE